MKKTVAVFIVLYVLSMGIMVGWGFIDKQSKENMSDIVSNSPLNPPGPDTGEKKGSEPNANPIAPVSSFSLDEVSRHNTQNDCWIAINENVYDVTKYLDFHPGGADLILTQCGKDATQAFNNQGGRGGGHSSKAKSLLAQYQIGVLK